MKNVTLNGGVILPDGSVVPVGECISISDSERLRLDPEGFYFADAADDAVPTAIIGSDTALGPVPDAPLKKPKKS